MRPPGRNLLEQPGLTVAHQVAHAASAFEQRLTDRMLVLSRKRGESVVVGGAVGFESMLEVTVLEIHGANVRLGFQIDAGVPVHRLEVWQRIQQSESGTKGLAEPGG